MANTSRALLESALRARRLDRTLTTTLPPPREAIPAVPSGVAALDAALGGGLPRGELSVIAGARSSGRTALLLHALAAATRRGEWAALVDAFDRVDPASLARAGVVAERFLWVRGPAVIESAIGPGGAGGMAVGLALKAWHLVLQAGSFGVAALDLADVPPAALAAVRFTTWLRMHRALEHGDTAGVLLASRVVARSPGGLALLLDGTARWAGASAGHRFTGLDARVRVRTARQWPAADVTVTCAAGES